MRELKRYKEEGLVLLILSLVLLSVRWVSSTVWPTTGQYDLAAQTETVFWVILRLVIYTLASWVALRVVMPKGYTWLKHGIVDGFDGLTAEQKTRYSTSTWAIFLLALVLLAIAGCSPALAANARICVVQNATADVGVREATGHNDGTEVERYLAHVNAKKGNAWCAAFVSYHLSQCGVDNPRSAWSPSFAGVGVRVWTARKTVRAPQPGDVFSVYFPNLKRVGHVGFVVGMEGKYLLTVEGNTSGPGSREGDGVYARRRELSKVYAVTNYIPDAKPTAGPLGHRHTTGLQRSQAHRRNHYDGTYRGGDYGDPSRYAAEGAEGRGASRGEARCACAGRATQEQAQGSGGEHGERNCGRGASRMRVRYHQHSCATVGPVHAGTQGQDRGAERGDSEVPRTRLGMVGSGLRHSVRLVGTVQPGTAPQTVVS